MRKHSPLRQLYFWGIEKEAFPSVQAHCLQLRFSVPKKIHAALLTSLCISSFAATKLAVPTSQVRMMAQPHRPLLPGRAVNNSSAQNEHVLEGPLTRHAELIQNPLSDQQWNTW